MLKLHFIFLFFFCKFDIICNSSHILYSNIFLSTLTFQTMSHINDFLGIIRGFRQVIEAGIKLQQENTKFLWNNSSIRPMLQNCSTNPIKTYKSDALLTSDLIERVFVVCHGFRQYATMHVPNFNTTVENTAAMDEKLKEEIEQLNREFDKTFESLKKAGGGKPDITAPISLEEIEAPLERVQVQTSIENTQQEIQPSVGKLQPSLKAQNTAELNPRDTVPKPVAKKKIRVSVSIKKILLFIRCIIQSVETVHCFFSSFSNLKMFV